MAMSGDPAFLGDPSRLNPEQLLLAAAVSCQLLSFLAVAARARIDVLGYEDDAEADMPEDVKPMRITAIRLRPRITVAAGTDPEKVQKLVALAHEHCFIANSLTSAMDIQATVVSGRARSASPEHRLDAPLARPRREPLERVGLVDRPLVQTGLEQEVERLTDDRPGRHPEELHHLATVERGPDRLQLLFGGERLDAGFEVVHPALQCGPCARCGSCSRIAGAR